MSDEAALAARLEDMATAYISGSVLSAAVELGVVDALDEPRTVADLAERTGTQRDGMERLCRALCAMGLLVRKGDLVEAPTALKHALSSTSPTSIAGVVRHHHRQLGPLLTHLADAIRTGQQQHAAWSFSSQPPADSPYAELARHPSEYALFLAAMDHGSKGVGASIVERVDLSKASTVVDLGGGGGAVARELLERLPNLDVIGFDVAAACEFARERSQAFASRHSIRVGDLLAGVDVTHADVVLLSAVLADWPSEEREVILRNALRVVRPGGLLLVSETLLDDDRQGPPNAAILSLVLLVAMRGDQLSGHELTREIEKAGFVGVEVHRGGRRDLIVARRPEA